MQQPALLSVTGNFVLIETREAYSSCPYQYNCQRHKGSYTLLGDRKTATNTNKHNYDTQPLLGKVVRQNGCNLKLYFIYISFSVLADLDELWQIDLEALNKDLQGEKKCSYQRQKDESLLIFIEHLSHQAVLK